MIRAAQQVGFSLPEIVEMLSGLPDDHQVTEAEWRALAESWRPQIDERIRVLEQLAISSTPASAAGACRSRPA